MNNKLIITDTSREHLSKAAYYAKVIAYIGLVISIIALCIDFARIIQSKFDMFELVTDVITMGGAIFLLLFAKKIEDAIYFNDSKLLTTAFSFFVIHLITIATGIFLHIFGMVMSKI